MRLMWRGKASLWSNKLGVNFVLCTSINPFLASVPILYPLKTTENLWLVFWCFQWYKMGTLARNGLKGPKASIYNDLLFSS